MHIVLVRSHSLGEVHPSLAAFAASCEQSATHHEPHRRGLLQRTKAWPQSHRGHNHGHGDRRPGRDIADGALTDKQGINRPRRVVVNIFSIIFGRIVCHVVVIAVEYAPLQAKCGFRSGYDDVPAGGVSFFLR